MSSTIGTTTFYVAPSKERHSLMSKLLGWEEEFWNELEHRNEPRHLVTVTRVDGFLTGEFETCDGYAYNVEFEKLYKELGELGYISEDHRQSWYSSNGDGGSDWYDHVGSTRYKIGTNIEARPGHWDYEPDGAEARRAKEKLKLFWLAFPNLMFMMKHEQPPTPEELAKESCQFLPERKRVSPRDRIDPPSALTANLRPAE